MNYVKEIYGNQMPEKVVKKAVAKAKGYQKKFGDDSQKDYHIQAVHHPILTDELKTYNLVASQQPGSFFSDKGVVIANIRMGFGHYRISMAIASCAASMGYTPYWFDLPYFKETTGGKIIAHLNHLYSMGSRWSSKYPLFNKFYWEPLNYQGFKKLSYNAADQAMAPLMTPIYQDLPKDMPLIATHVWPAQAAISAKMTRVVNAIPDNWPMALHLAQGSVHTVQTYSSYFGYKTLKGMKDKEILRPMDSGSLFYTGHYVDHELVVNLLEDTQKRINRIQNKEAKRILMTIGGAGAQSEFYADMIRELLDQVKKDEVVLYINVGDHQNAFDRLLQLVPELNSFATIHRNEWEKTKDFALKAIDQDVRGVHLFYDQDIYAAVYSTNLLMRSSDILVTKPSELSFYPVPKLFIQRVGGHEMWGAIHSAEIGDGTPECETVELANQMMSLLLKEDEHLIQMNQVIIRNYHQSIYHGGYEVVKLAVT